MDNLLMGPDDRSTLVVIPLEIYFSISSGSQYSLRPEDITIQDLVSEDATWEDLANMIKGGLFTDENDLYLFADSQSAYKFARREFLDRYGVDPA